MEEKLHTIGALSRRSGVPVKTIRHYSDFGVLPPSGVSEAGYRLYSEADRSRLEMIRTFRAAGFGLPTIKRLFSREVRPPRPSNSNWRRWTFSYGRSNASGRCWRLRGRTAARTRR